MAPSPVPLEVADIFRAHTGTTPPPALLKAAQKAGPVTMPLGGKTVELPLRADDPRIADIVAQVKAELYDRHHFPTVPL